jgi:hypothetical protein
MYRNLLVTPILLGTICILGASCNSPQEKLHQQISESVNAQPAAVDPVTMPSVPRPEYLKPFTDSVFGTTVIRLSDRAAFGSNLQELRHLYSKNQPWNADESYLLLNYKYPAALLNGRSYKFVRWVRQPSQSVWSNINPSIMYGTIANSNQFVKLDIAKSDNYTILRKFREYDRIDFGQWNGNLSNDDRQAALVGLKAGKLDLLVYNLQQNRVTARKTQPKGTTERSTAIGVGTARIDSISMSQSGKYVILQYHQTGQGFNRGIHLLDRKLKFVRQLSQRGGSHFDSCVDAKGAEAIVVQDNLSSAIVSVDYSTGQKTTLLPADRSNYNIHISCRNLNRPGWAYISEFAGDIDPNTVKTTLDRTFALKLDGSGTIEQFAPPNHSLNTAYERQPHSVPNRDGTKVLFASDWGNPAEPVYSYVTQQKARFWR